jgi:hypothetical protein
MSAGLALYHREERLGGNEVPIMYVILEHSFVSCYNDIKIRRKAQPSSDRPLQIATDRCIMFFLFIIFLGVIAIIIVKVRDKNIPAVQLCPSVWAAEVYLSPHLDVQEGAYSPICRCWWLVVLNPSGY